MCRGVGFQGASSTSYPHPTAPNALKCYTQVHDVCAVVRHASICTAIQHADSALLGSWGHLLGWIEARMRFKSQLGEHRMKAGVTNTLHHKRDRLSTATARTADELCHKLSVDAFGSRGSMYPCLYLVNTCPSSREIYKVLPHTGNFKAKY